MRDIIHSLDRKNFDFFVMKSDSRAIQVNEICSIRGLFETPELNNTLLLNDLGITVLPDLRRYSSVICLHLENNLISDISSLVGWHRLQTLCLRVCGTLTLPPCLI